MCGGVAPFGRKSEFALRYCVIRQPLSPSTIDVNKNIILLSTPRLAPKAEMNIFILKA
jgi:hypothetical protein